LTSILSGGQRKRLSVAIELLLRPRLLVLDEPTSGLDPGMQANLMDRLRGLARQGITVVTSSHTLDTLHYFDSVIVLARRGGSTTCIFHGPPAGLLPAFNKRDLADLFDYLSCENESESPNSDSPLLQDMGNQAQRGGAAPSTNTDRMSLPPGAIARRQRDRRRIVRQAGIVAHRSWLVFRRDSMALRLAICQPFLLAGLIVFSQSTAEKSVFIHAFLVISAIWLGMTVAVREIVRERTLYLRDRLAGLQPNGYLLGKALFAAAVAAVQASLLFVTAKCSGFLFLENGEPYTHLVTMSHHLLGGLGIAAALGLGFILTAIGGAFIGLTVSTFVRTEQAAVALLPLIILPQLLLSRVSSQDVAKRWQGDPECTYVPIANSGEGVRHAPVKFLLSLPLLSRPATAAIDMLSYANADDQTVPWTWLICEWIYLIFLVAAYGALACYAFHSIEKHWHSSR
jgi:hypothetical protein